MLNGPEQTNEFGDYSVETEYGNLIRASEDGKIELRSRNAAEGATVVIYDNLGQIKAAKSYRNPDFAFEKFIELSGSNETLEQFYGVNNRVEDEEDLDGDLYEGKQKIIEGGKVIMKVPTEQTPQPQELQQSQPEELPAENAPEMGGEQPTGQETETPFGNEKFDAGIDVDEDADPKKYIEKLTGKLAQKLRDYNGTNQDDILNKFVINSLIPASVPQMSDEDAQDVIKKVQDNIGKEQSNGGEPNLEQPTTPEPEQPQETKGQEPEQQQQLPPKMESKVAKSSKKVVKESEAIDALIEKYLNGEEDVIQNVTQNPKSKIFKTPEFK